MLTDDEVSHRLDRMRAAEETDMLRDVPKELSEDQLRRIETDAKLAYLSAQSPPGAAEAPC